MCKLYQKFPIKRIFTITQQTIDIGIAMQNINYSNFYFFIVYIYKYDHLKLSL